MGASQEVGGFSRGTRVYLHLYAAQEFGDALYFVDNERSGMLGHEVRTIRFRCPMQVGVFKVDVSVVGEQHLRQGSLARLPWPNDQDNGVLASHRFQPFSHLSLYHPSLRQNPKFNFGFSPTAFVVLLSGLEINTDWIFYF